MSTNMDSRLSCLQRLTGLDVRLQPNPKAHCFDFYYNGQCVKTIFTYKKARAFAQGYALGRQLLVVDNLLKSKDDTNAD